jgi:predicted transposase YbfD/YdcC
MGHRGKGSMEEQFLSCRRFDMDANAPDTLLRWFGELDDPRPGRNVMHRLSDMLAIAILAVLCGADSWVDVATFGRCKLPWLRTFLALPHGTPSHDTFGRVFGRPALAQSDCRLIAIDGKTLRRSFDTASGKAAIHMVSAWATANHISLGQLTTEAKSNEITAIPALLELLDLKGAVVTIDAMGCQKAIAETIVDGGGDYILQVKDNHPSLRADLELLFAEGMRTDCLGVRHEFTQDVTVGHGRVETRRLWATEEVAWYAGASDWKGLSRFICIESIRQIGQKRSVERRYYLSSLRTATAEFLLRTIRGHWGVENGLHWCLDVSFNEDHSRIRQGHAAENFSRLRRLALNLLKKDKTFKVGLKTKAKACSWDHQYLLNILTQ